MIDTHRVIVNGRAQRIEGVPSYAHLVYVATGSTFSDGYTVAYRVRMDNNTVRSGSVMPRETLPLVDGMIINVART